MNLGWFIFSAYKNERKSSLACQLDPNSGNLNSFHIQLVANDVCVCPSLILALWPSQSWGHPDFFPGSNFSSICLHQSPRKSCEEAEMMARDIMLFSDSLVAP